MRHSILTKRLFKPSKFAKRPFFEVFGRLSEGDVVLFRTKKFTSKLQRAMCRTGFDHIGIVVIDEACPDSCCSPRFKELRVKLGVPAWHTLEADASGVDVYPFTPESLASYRGMVAIRHLGFERGALTGAMSGSLHMFMEEVKGRPYERRWMELLRAANWFGHNDKEDLSTLFCSQLVAAAYQRMGVVSRAERSSNAYIPGDFATNASAKRAVKLQKGAYLSEEVVIDVVNLSAPLCPPASPKSGGGGAGANGAGAGANGAGANGDGGDAAGSTPGMKEKLAKMRTAAKESLRKDRGAEAHAPVKRREALGTGEGGGDMFTDVDALAGVRMQLLAADRMAHERSKAAGIADEGADASRLAPAADAAAPDVLFADRVTIAPWSKLQQEIEVHTPGSEVSWEFYLHNDDLLFNITDEDDTPIVPSKVCMADEIVHGTGTLKDPCKIVFCWDNTYSWMTEKTLDLRISVVDPNQRDGGGGAASKATITGSTTQRAEGGKPARGGGGGGGSGGK